MDIRKMKIRKWVRILLRELNLIDDLTILIKFLLKTNEFEKSLIIT